MLNKLPKRAYLSLFLIAVIGTSLSVTAFIYTQQWENEQLTATYEKELDNYARILRHTFNRFDNVLGSLRSLHSIHDVDRENFSRFIQTELRHLPGLQALSWIGYVPEKNRTNVELKLHAEGINTAHFWEYDANKQPQIAETRPVHYPILFIEPTEENKRYIGFDLASEPVLKAALEEARDSGLFVISKHLPIADKQSTINMFMPIYQRDTDPQTKEARHNHLIGFASGTVQIDELVYTILRANTRKTEVFLRIVDETNRKIQPLYSPTWYAHNPKFEQDAVALCSIPLVVGGRQWRIILAYLPEHISFLVSFNYAWWILITGLIFTFGLFRYMYLILNHAHWSEVLIAKRTQNLVEVNETLDTTRRRFQAVFNEAPIGIVQVDLDGKVVDSNEALHDMLDYDNHELMGHCLSNFVHPDDMDLNQQILKRLVYGQIENYSTDIRYRFKGGQTVWTNQSCSIVKDTAEPFIIAMIKDITEHKCAEEARLLAEKKYREIFENAREGIFQCTSSGHYLSINPAFIRMFGYESAQQMFREVIDIGQQVYLKPERYQEFIELLNTQDQIENFEYEACCRDGSIIWVNETVHVVRDAQGYIQHYEGIVEDITARKQIEKQLRYEASHDQLTGLLNRHSFQTYLDKALFCSQKNQNMSYISFAVLFVDLDRFKIVNDSMGHLVGDTLLTQIAQRLREEVKKQNGIVARFGGDEFAILLEKIPDFTDLEQRIEHIQNQLEKSYTLKNEVFNTTASIGVAIASRKYNSADEILRDADTAMYEAKNQGRGKSVIFQQGMHTHVVNVLRIERDLRKAFDNNEFCLYYQPIISLENQNTVSLEALLRWNHPKKGFIRPDEFIPIAEETGLIRELGLWVFETACLQLKAWQEKYPHHAKLGMNINVSPIQLKHPRLVRQIQDILEKTGVKGTDCRVEITETAVMQDPNAMFKILNELKSLEVLLYIDDFGTGYTSLEYLKEFPIDALKIDKTFIREINAPGKSAQIAAAIIALGEAFDLKVVAEGVENNFQVAILKATRCHHVQGFLFSRPKDIIEAEHFLETKIINIPNEPLQKNTHIPNPS